MSGGNNFRTEVIETVWNKTGGRCWYCGTETTRMENFGDVHKTAFTVDHFIPKCLGGKNEMQNLVPACFSCNAAKRGKSIEIFRLQRSRELSGITSFNEIQLTYLCMHGIELPKITPFVFYFELEGLKP